MPQFDKNTPTAFQNNAEDKQREIAARGGVASGEAKRRKKTLRQELEAMLEAIIQDKRGNDVSVQQSITGALIKKANSGDVKAYEVIRDTIGQKPAQEVNIGGELNSKIKYITPESVEDIKKHIADTIKDV